jgi:hypothetical protein
MMVDGAEEGQLRGPIDVLAPYTSATGIGAGVPVAPRRSTSVRVAELLSRAGEGTNRGRRRPRPRWSRHRHG